MTPSLPESITSSTRDVEIQPRLIGGAAAGALYLVEIGGREYRLPEGATIVGRAADADILIESPAISRHHARFTRHGGVVVVEDLGSRNGTHFGDRRLDSPIEIPDGCAIRFGPIWCTFFARRERR